MRGLGFSNCRIGVLTYGGHSRIRGNVFGLSPSGSDEMGFAHVATGGVVWVGGPLENDRNYFSPAEIGVAVNGASIITNNFFGDLDGISGVMGSSAVGGQEGADVQFGGVLDYEGNEVRDYQVGLLLDGGINSRSLRVTGSLLDVDSPVRFGTVPTPNDPDDVDVGVNGLQNHPELSVVTFDSATGEVAIDISIDGVPGDDHLIEIYANGELGRPNSATELIYRSVFSGPGQDTPTREMVTILDTAIPQHLTAFATNLATGETSEATPGRRLLYCGNPHLRRR